MDLDSGVLEPLTVEGRVEVSGTVSVGTVRTGFHSSWSSRNSPCDPFIRRQSRHGRSMSVSALGASPSTSLPSSLSSSFPEFCSRNVDVRSVCWPYSTRISSSESDGGHTVSARLRVRSYSLALVPAD